MRPPRIPLAALCPLLAALLRCLPSHAQLRQLTGKVTDGNGLVISNAAVSSSALKTSTDPAGLFQLSLPPGPQTLRVSAAGYTPFLGTFIITDAPTQTFTIILPNLLPNDPGSVPEVPILTTADVTVTATPYDVAEAQIHQEEQQRLLGAIPNFYVTYDAHATPLTPGQKWQLGWHSALDPVTLLVNAGFAGIQQAADDYPGYHQGASGYFKRFGANTADTTIGTLLGGVALPIVFRQDPRYFYLGHGTIRHRTLYALSTAFRSRGDNGKWQPAYASILGDLSEGALSNLYYPASDRHGPGLTLENGSIGIAADAVNNVIQEFVLRHLTPKLPPTQP